MQNQGTQQFYAGNFSQAEKLFKAGLERFIALNHRQGIALCQDTLGAALQEQGKLERAQRYYARALKEYGQIGSRRNEANCLLSQGALFSKIGNFARASKNYEQSLDTFLALGDPASAALSRQNLGVALAKTGRLDTALRELELARREIQGLGDKWDQILVLYSYGMALNDNGQLNDALSVLLEALENSQQIQANGLTCGLNVELGHTLINLGRHQDAETYLKTGIAMAEQAGFSAYKLEATAATFYVKWQNGELDPDPASLQEIIDHISKEPALANAERPFLIYAYLIEALHEIDLAAATHLFQLAQEQLAALTRFAPSPDARQALLDGVPDRHRVTQLSQQYPKLATALPTQKE